MYEFWRLGLKKPFCFHPLSLGTLKPAGCEAVQSKLLGDTRRRGGELKPQQRVGTTAKQVSEAIIYPLASDEPSDD